MNFPFYFNKNKCRNFNNKKMGVCNQTTNRRNKKVINSNDKDKFECKFTLEELNEKLNNFYNDFEIMKNKDLNKNNYMDLTFAQIQKYEEEKLSTCFLGKKDQFKGKIYDYFLGDILEQIHITDNLIEIENGYDIFEKKIKNKIEEICESRDEFSIKYLTIMILGKSGVGKSTLINQFLKLKTGQRAQTGIGEFQTIDTKVYKNKTVPFIRLVDTRGIELNQGYGASDVKTEAEKYIKEKLQLGDMNDFVHCFWYCITGTRFEQAEIDLLNSLRATYKDNNIPIIIVYTQATDDEAIASMKKFVKEKKIEGDFIQILAQRKKINNAYVEPFNLEILLQETINKCRKALKGEMKSIMASNISTHLKKLIKEENEQKFLFVHEKIVLDFVENYNLNSDFHFQQYIIDNIFGKSIKYFLEKDIMNESSSNFIKETHFIEKINQYIQFSKKTCDELMENDLSRLAYDFLDYQAIKEKETKKNILIDNKRTHKDFIETSKNFFENNFRYASQILYITYLINQHYFVANLKEKLNQITEKILGQKDIVKKISDCFLKKFKQFENENKDNFHNAFNKYVDISDNNIKNDDDNLPPADNIQEYPDESQIAKPEINIPTIKEKKLDLGFGHSYDPIKI